MEFPTVRGSFSHGPSWFSNRMPLSFHSCKFYLETLKLKTSNIFPSRNILLSNGFPFLRQMTGESLGFALFCMLPLLRRATLNRMALLWHGDIHNTRPSVSHSSNLHNQDIRRPHRDHVSYHMVFPTPGRRLWGFLSNRLLYLDEDSTEKGRKAICRHISTCCCAATRSWL